MMSTFTVNFMNRVSGWLHSSVVVVAADVAEAEKVAREAFDLVHGFTAAHTDPQTGAYVPTSGTPGYDSTSFTTAVAPVVAGDATPLGQAVAAAGGSPVPVDVTSGQPVQTDSARTAADAESAAADLALAQATARAAAAKANAARADANAVAGGNVYPPFVSGIPTAPVPVPLNPATGAPYTVPVPLDAVAAAEAALVQAKANAANSLPAPVVNLPLTTEVPAPYTPVQ